MKGRTEMEQVWSHGSGEHRGHKHDSRGNGVSLLALGSNTFLSNQITLSLLWYHREKKKKIIFFSPLALPPFVAN